MVFADRSDAGRRLAEKLRHLRGAPVVVLGLPRGGVPVAFEVARALNAPLDVILVRKLGVPFQREVAMGAISEGGVRIINDDVVARAGVAQSDLAAVEREETTELDRRARRFRGDRERPSLKGRTVVVVDDGIATGATARAACEVARARGARSVVLAVPVAPAGWEARIGHAADKLVCLQSPDEFSAIGQFYADFTQTSDEEVVSCLARAAHRQPVAVPPTRVIPARADPLVMDRDVIVEAAPVELGGHLTVPADAVGIVLFAHGSGSSRHSPRNRYVAAELNRARLATLLLDLLTTGEEHERANVFDVELLAGRLVEATHWLRRSVTADLPVGYFGASTGAAAALWAATEPGTDIAAVVSRGGRPDLAGPRLDAVKTPTLLIVGGRDDLVLDLNRLARQHLHGDSHLAVIPGATHLFDEPGTLQAVAEMACAWFIDHLTERVRTFASGTHPEVGAGSGVWNDRLPVTGHHDHGGADPVPLADRPEEEP